MISLLVAYLALFNRWLDDGGTVANFYDKPGLTHRLQGNVEFMRQFGRGGGGGGGKKQFIPWVSTLLRQTYVCFDKESHGSSIHPDLNMSEFSRLAIGKSFLGKVVRFFLQFNIEENGQASTFLRRISFFSLGRDLQKTITNFTPLSELPGICGEDVCLFVESESFDTGGPNTCPTAIEHFLKKGENTFQPSAFCHFLTL